MAAEVTAEAGVVGVAGTVVVVDELAELLELGEGLALELGVVVVVVVIESPTGGNDSTASLTKKGFDSVLIPS